MNKRIDDLNRSVLHPVILNLAMCNPGSGFSLEQIHDYLIKHFKLDLSQTTSTQRTRFSQRMRRTLDHLAEVGLLRKERQRVALNNGYRLKFYYQKHEI